MELHRSEYSVIKTDLKFPLLAIFDFRSYVEIIFRCVCGLSGWRTHRKWLGQATPGWPVQQRNLIRDWIARQWHPHRFRVWLEKDIIIIYRQITSNIVDCRVAYRNIADLREHLHLQVVYLKLVYLRCEWWKGSDSLLSKSSFELGDAG